MSAAAGDLILFGLVPALCALWLVLLVARAVQEARRPRSRVTRWGRER